MAGVSGRFSMRLLDRFRVVAPLLLAAASPAACSTPPAASPAVPSAPGAAANGSPIKIGYMADANGTSAPIAAGMHLGTDLAVQQVNAAGGINGHPLQGNHTDA